MMPRIYALPWWALALAFGVFVGAALDVVRAERAATHATRSLVACEARAQETLVTATQCNSHLTTCLGAVSRIATELELSEVEF